MEQQKDKSKTERRGASPLKRGLAPREIKFRAYIKSLDKIVNVEALRFSDEAIVIGESELTIYPTDYDLMQFTGLKDKNDKELYEGDIIDIENGISKAIVKFKKGCFYAPEGYRLGGWENNLVEIIGNVFENPELLP